MPEGYHTLTKMLETISTNKQVESTFKGLDMGRTSKTQTRGTEKRNRRISTDKVNNTETIIIRKECRGRDNIGTIAT